MEWGDKGRSVGEMGNVLCAFAVMLIKCSYQRASMVAITCVWGVRSQTNDCKQKGTTRRSVTWKRSGVFSLTGWISTRFITPRNMTEIILRRIVKCWSVIVHEYIWRHVGNSVWRCHLGLLGLTLLITEQLSESETRINNKANVKTV